MDSGCTIIIASAGDGNAGAIRIQHMVVIAGVRSAGGDKGYFLRLQIQPPQLTLAVATSVICPVSMS